MNVLRILLTITALTSVFCNAGYAASETEEGYVSLFNGKDLSGWVQYGGEATYRVEDGAIVGECAPNVPNNTFLCTEKEFGNFIFKCEFKVDVPGNSGIQFRSHVRCEDDLQRVFGYQCEIDPSEGFDTGRIYDEGRRGHQYDIVWLNDIPTENHRKAIESYRSDDWNTLEIQCVGPSIRTWVNGIPMTNIFDTEDMSGFFGLQIHSGTEGKLRWRNLRVLDLGTSEWKSFFGQNKDGALELVDAYAYLPECWSYTEKDGRKVFHGHHSADESRDGLIVSCHSYDHFAARVSYRINGGNSALYFRAEEVKTPWLLRGYQNEISGDNAEAGIWHTAGTDSDPPGRGWLGKNESLVETVRHHNDWNTVSTVALDDHLMTFLNGYNIVDIRDPEGEKKGKLALQLHGGAENDMWFCHFDVMEITPEMKELILR